MDCSVHEDCLFHLHLLQEEETEESNKEQVVLLFFFFFLAPSYCCACFKCYFEDLLLTVPILGGGDVECFLSILVILRSPFVFPPGAKGHGHSFFSNFKLPSGKETPAPQVK